MKLLREVRLFIILVITLSSCNKLKTEDELIKLSSEVNIDGFTLKDSLFVVKKIRVLPDYEYPKIVFFKKAVSKEEFINIENEFKNRELDFSCKFFNDKTLNGFGSAYGDLPDVIREKEIFFNINNENILLQNGFAFIEGYGKVLKSCDSINAILKVKITNDSIYGIIDVYGDGKILPSFW